MKRLIAVLAVVAVLLAQRASSPPVNSAGREVANGMTFALWEKADADAPRLTFYGYGGPVMLVAPEKNEGRAIAAWLNSLGISAAVLDYRRESPANYAELDVGKRAVRLLRARADELGIDADRIGVIGFSNGGHLAAAVSSQGDDGSEHPVDRIDRFSSRVSFAVLAYATSDRERAEALERYVTKRNPPTFLYHGTADKLAPVEQSVRFYLALKQAGVPAELHTFTWQGHGGGLNLSDASSGAWSELLVNWLRVRGVIGQATRDAASSKTLNPFNWRSNRDSP